MVGFSRNTVVRALDVLDLYLTQAATSHFLLTLGSEIRKDVKGEQVSVRRRMNDLIEFVDEHPRYPIDDGHLETVLVEKAVELDTSNNCEDWWSEEVSRPPAIVAFRQALRRDGFSVEEGALMPALPMDVRLPSIQTELTSLLRKHALTTAEGHLKQALDGHVDGNWASANGQLRTFFDAVLDCIAIHIDPSADMLASGQARRSKLAKSGFFSVELNEWDNDGKGYINGLVKRLHPQGAHPGLSDEEDCTFRLHIVLITMALLLRRYDRWVS